MVVSILRARNIHVNVYSVVFYISIRSKDKQNKKCWKTSPLDSIAGRVLCIKVEAYSSSLQNDRGNEKSEKKKHNVVVKAPPPFPVLLIKSHNKIIYFSYSSTALQISRIFLSPNSFRIITLSALFPSREW